MEQTIYSADMGEWSTNMNNKVKERFKFWSKFNTRTFLKSRKFHEQIGSLGFELALKDYLLAVAFLFQLLSKAGFVIQNPRESLLLLLKVIWNKLK